MNLEEDWPIPGVGVTPPAIPLPPNWGDAADWPKAGAVAAAGAEPACPKAGAGAPAAGPPNKGGCADAEPDCPKVGAVPD